MIAFVITALSAVALAVVYWRGGQVQAEGGLLFLALAGLGYGFITWANHLMPPGPVTGPREQLSSGSVEQDATESDFERGGQLTSRRAILGSLGAAGAALGLAALFPIRSFGPAPGRSLLVTPWQKGLRLVTDDGRPVHINQVPVEGLVTVFPEGHAGSADGQAVLIRVTPGMLKPNPARADWTPEDFVAYSKVCTHAGCPVGLYQVESHQLLCPCHQSTFDVLREARPVFGPAAAPLPQLPLKIDKDGYLIAQGDFSAPVGPAFWSRR